MPKVKPLGKSKKVLSKIEKAELRAANMIANDKKMRDADKQRAYKQYIEYKLIKGHSQEDAEKMAKEIVYNQQVV
jgi:ribonuclease HI